MNTQLESCAYILHAYTGFAVSSRRFLGGKKVFITSSVTSPDKCYLTQPRNCRIPTGHLCRLNLNQTSVPSPRKKIYIELPIRSSADNTVTSLREVYANPGQPSFYAKRTPIARGVLFIYFFFLICF